MGIMLLAATLAMRGLDWFYAGNRAERKDIRRTAGLFTMAAGLTLYAVSPYAWANPVAYLLTNLAFTVNHPAVWPQPFQGKLIPSNELPPYYAAVYSGLATPPLILLLGLIGTIAVLAQGRARPGAAFRNGRLRFVKENRFTPLPPPIQSTRGPGCPVLGENCSPRTRKHCRCRPKPTAPIPSWATIGYGRARAAWPLSNCPRPPPAT